MNSIRSRLLPLLAVAPLAAQNPCGVPHALSTPLPTGVVDARLNDVHAFSSQDLWAVGHVGRDLQGNRNTYSWILHWDGTRFSEVPSPSPGIPNLRTWCELQAVGGASPNDVWAAGTYERQFPNNGHIGPQMLLMHWDGSAWTQVPEPLPQFTYMASSSGTRIDEIVAFATDNVWFFGWWPGDQFTGAGPLTMRWDGSNFQIVDIAPLPNSNSRWRFLDVDALSPTEFWGIATVGSGNYSHYVARWNGSSWTRMTTIPTQPVTYYDLRAVAPITSNDVWVTGVESPLQTGGVLPYAIHWNGSSWTRHAMAGFANELVAFASNDVWAFGTAIEHWNGTAWTVVQDFGRTLESAQSWEAVATGPCELWTVGTQWAGAGSPPVMALAARVGGPQAGSATLRMPCAVPALRQSLLPLSTPRIGQNLRVAVDDPMGRTGITGSNVPTLWVFAFGGGAAFPCGVVLPGLAPGGGPVEALLDGSATVATSAIWAGRGQPAEHVVPVPALGNLIGTTFATQAAMLGGNGIVLTSAIDLRIGQ